MSVYTMNQEPIHVLRYLQCIINLTQHNIKSKINDFNIYITKNIMKYVKQYWPMDRFRSESVFVNNDIIIKIKINTPITY